MLAFQLSPLMVVSFGIYENCNHAWILTEIIIWKLRERGYLSLILNELWCGLIVVSKKSDPIDQRIIINYEKCVI